MEEHNCPICLKLLSEYPQTELPCHHKYHTVCMFEWFKKKENCPLCRGNILEKKIQFPIDYGEYTTWINIEEEISLEDVEFYEHRFEQDKSYLIIEDSRMANQSLLIIAKKIIRVIYPLNIWTFTDIGDEIPIEEQNNFGGPSHCINIINFESILKLYENQYHSNEKAVFIFYNIDWKNFKKNKNFERLMTRSRHLNISVIMICHLHWINKEVIPDFSTIIRNNINYLVIIGSVFPVRIYRQLQRQYQIDDIENVRHSLRNKHLVKNMILDRVEYI